MLYRIIQLLTLTLIVCNHQVASSLATPVTKIGILIFNSLIHEIKLQDDDSNSQLLLNKINEQSRKLDKFIIHFDQQFDVASQRILSDIPNIMSYNNAMAELRHYITRINELYYTYINIYANSTDYYDDRFNNYINTLISYNANDLQSTLVLMDELITAGQTSMILQSPMDMFIKLGLNVLDPWQLNQCGKTISMQQHLFYIFMKIITSEAKGCILTVFAYTSLMNRNGTNCERELHLRFESSLHRLSKYDALLENKIVGINRAIYNCQLNDEKRGKTYIEFERLAQGVIFNTKEMGDSYCKQDCHMMSNKKSNKCAGKLINCQEIGTKDVSVCISPKGSSRRYEWYKNKKLLGANTMCQGTVQKLPLEKHHKTIILGSMFTGYNTGSITNHCKYCACTCIRNKKYSKDIIRTVSLVQQTSDIEKNMIVIGVRFVIKDNIVHIQIKQGKLLPYGAIMEGSESWVKLPDINRTSIIHNRCRNTQGEKRTVKCLRADNAILYLDDIMAPPNHVITGVSFNSFTKIAASKKEWPFSISITTSKLNWQTGKLLINANTKNIKIKNNPNNSPDYDRPRTEIKFNNPDNPFKSHTNNPHKQTNRFIKFTMSDLNKDAGQSTVPFLDARQVIVQPAFPLGGVGLYYNGAPGYGGFIALKLFTVDVTQLKKIPHSDRNI